LSAEGRDADARRLDDVDGLDAECQDKRGIRRPLAWFLSMWVVMIDGDDAAVAAPMLWRYRQGGPPAVANRASHVFTMLAGLGYFFVWIPCSVLAVFPLGVRAGQPSEMETTGTGSRCSGRGRYGHPHRRRSPAHLLEGASPCLLPGKRRRAASHWRQDAGTAWRQGVRFGIHCGLSCANSDGHLLVFGVMDPARNGLS